MTIQGSSQPDHHPASLVLVTHEFYPHRGGIAVYAAEMARAACELQYRVEVWAPALPAGVAEPVWPFVVRRLPLSGDHSLRSQWRIARELVASADRLKVSSLYIPEPGPLLAMLLLQYFDTIRPERLLLTFHGSEIQRLASRRILRWSTNHLLTKAARISVVSEYARTLLQQHFPKAGNKVVVTPGALRPDLRRNQSSPTALSGAKTIILTVARLNPRKGQREVIQALKALPAGKRASLEYWIVGAHGLPIIAHAIGGVPEAVIDGETGLLVIPGDTTALTAAFARLIDDSNLRRRLGEAARVRSLQRTWLDSAVALFGPPTATPHPQSHD